LAEIEPETLAPRDSRWRFISSRLVVRVPVMTMVLPARGSGEVSHCGKVQRTLLGLGLHRVVSIQEGPGEALLHGGKLILDLVRTALQFCEFSQQTL